MEQLKKAIRTGKTGRKMTNQFLVDGDVNVPEGKSDVGRIVYSQAVIRVDEKKVVESYVRVSGRILYQILYLTEGENDRMAVLQGKLPFEEMVYMEEPAEGPIWMTDGNVELAVTPIHARKLRIRAMAELELVSCREEEQYLTMDVEEEPGVCRRQRSVEILTLHKTVSDSFRIKEECAIPKQSEAIGTVLFTDVTRKRAEVRIGTGELQIRGELAVFVFYESVEGNFGWTEQTLPYTGKVTCLGAEETMYYQTDLLLADAAVDARMDENGELRILGVEAVMEIRALVYGEEKAEVLEDLYSLTEQVMLEKSAVELQELIQQKTCEYTFAEQMQVLELSGQVLQICHSTGRVRVEHTEIVADGILCEGILQTELFYLRADDQNPFELWQGMIPFTYVIECRNAAAGMEYELQTNCGQPGITLLGNGEAEIKAVIEFQVFLKRPIFISNITEIRTEPLDKKALADAPGIVGYVIKEGDKLWDLARKYHTTETRIREDNEIQEEEPKTGEKILIFKGNLGIL